MAVSHTQHRDLGRVLGSLLKALEARGFVFDPRAPHGGHNQWHLSLTKHRGPGRVLGPLAELHVPREVQALWGQTKAVMYYRGSCEML